MRGSRFTKEEVWELAEKRYARQVREVRPYYEAAQTGQTLPTTHWLTPPIAGAPREDARVFFGTAIALDLTVEFRDMDDHNAGLVGLMALTAVPYVFTDVFVHNIRNGTGGFVMTGWLIVFV